MGSPSSEFDQLAAKYELPSKIIRLFSDLHRVSPQAAKALIHDLAALAGVRPAGNRGDASPDAFESVRQYFAATGNAPVSKTDLATGAKVSEHSVHTLLYRSAKDKFESLPSPAGGKAKVYRLKEEALP